MNILLELLLQNYPLRDKEGAAGADGGGADKTADLAAQVAALKAQVKEMKAGKKEEFALRKNLRCECK